MFLKFAIGLTTVCVVVDTLLGFFMKSAAACFFLIGAFNMLLDVGNSSQR